jgi:hypothetical protein
VVPGRPTKVHPCESVPCAPVCPERHFRCWNPSLCPPRSDLAVCPPSSNSQPGQSRANAVPAAAGIAQHENTQSALGALSCNREVPWPW